jgi:hypothetical protein
MRYIATITPLEPYTFGTDQGSRYEGARETGKESYIIESSLMPEQTTILGTLRYIVLANKGLLRSDFNYGNDRSKIDAAIGSESFSFKASDRKFGVIKSISPIYIVANTADNENPKSKKIYISNPFCNKHGRDVEKTDFGFEPVKMEENTIFTSFGKIQLPAEDEYKAKDGHGNGFIEITENALEIKQGHELFAKNVITGNRADNRNQDNKDGFFKREIVSFNHKSEKADNVKYSFEVEIEADENSFPNQIVAYMGRKRSAFLFKFEKTDGDSIDTKAKNALKSVGSKWYYALSDLYLENYKAEQFAFVETKKIRNLETHLSKDSYVSKREKSEQRITLIKAGSVFRQDITDIAAGCKAAGYNHIIEIGGND